MIPDDAGEGVPMTFQLTALYHHPVDPVAFDEHYESTHAPLASKILTSSGSPIRLL